MFGIFKGYNVLFLFSFLYFYILRLRLFYIFNLPFSLLFIFIFVIEIFVHGVLTSTKQDVQCFMEVSDKNTKLMTNKVHDTQREIKVKGQKI